MDELLSPMELTALPPLSPTMEKAFSEAFADMSELEKGEPGAVVKVEPTNSVDVTATTFSPGPTTAQERHKNMSPSEKKAKGVTTFQDAAEAKRARRSAIEKKSRQRRQHVLRRMRDEVQKLEDVYAEMAKRRDAAEAGGQRRSPVLMDSRRGCGNGNAEVEELQRKYSELSLVANALEEDQATLQTLLTSHEVFERTVRTLSEEKQAREQDVWDSGVPHSSSFEVKFRQHSIAECYEIVRESYAEIQRFAENHQYETTGANFMGWTDKRKYDQQTKALQYGFTKKFPLENPEELLMKTWKMFADGHTMEHMSFDGSVNTRFEMLQTLNDDLMIIRKDHRIPNIPTTFASVQIVFRLQTPSGYTLCMRTISAPEIEEAMEPHEYFYHIFHWTHFNRLYDEYGHPAGCELIAAGSIADQNQLKSTYWLFELVCSILRWENACVAPLFLKQI